MGPPFLIFVTDILRHGPWAEHWGTSIHGAVKYAGNNTRPGCLLTEWMWILLLARPHLSITELSIVPATKGEEEGRWDTVLKEAYARRRWKEQTLALQTSPILFCLGTKPEREMRRCKLEKELSMAWLDRNCNGNSGLRNWREWGGLDVRWGDRGAEPHKATH